MEDREVEVEGKAERGIRLGSVDRTWVEEEEAGVAG